MKCNRFLRRLLRDRLGATAVEYALIVALIFVAIVGAIAALSQGTGALWSSVSEKAGEAR